MKLLRRTHLLALPLLAAGLATSCIDNDYDLDDVDYTLGIETDLTLPTCSTDTIYLRNFMDLKEDGVIQYVWDATRGDSMFCVKKSGEAHVDPIDIDEIRIRRPQMSGFSASVPLKSLLGGRTNQPQRIKITIDTPLGPQTADFDQEFEYELKAEDTRYEVQPARATGISADIVSVSHVGINAVKATMEVRVVGFPAYIDKIHLDGMTLAYPEGLHVRECTFNGTPCEPVAGESAFRLTDECDEKGVSLADGIGLELTLDGMDEGKSFLFDATSHTATFQGTFALTGTVRISTEEFVEEQLKTRLEEIAHMDPTLLAQILRDKDLTSIVPDEINVKGEAEMSSDIVLHSFSGSIKHSVDRIDPIRLDDLPDFLNDEDVVMDLDNPMLLLNVANGLPAQIGTAMTLTSTTCPAPVRAEGISVMPGTNLFYLADKAVQALPDGYEGATRLSHQGSVPALIKKIPDQIDVDIDACTMEAHDFDITRTYNIGINYDVFAPVTFGKDFLMVYQDTENGWAEDLEDLEDLDAERIELAGLIDNDLPAGLLFTLEPIDREGKRITQLLVDNIEVTSGKNQKFAFSLRAAQGHTINDALAGKNGVNKLDGIRYKASLKGQPGETLYRKASIKVHTITASLKGKVSYDAN